jgi:flagellar biosynthetic protein FliP
MRAALLLLLVIAIIPTASGLQAQTMPKINVSVDGGDGEDGGGLSTTIQILLLLTVLALAPSIVIMTTSFIRVVIVLGFLRQALGTHQMPPSQLLMGMALILTMFVMSPVISQVHDNALGPYMKGEINQQQLYEEGSKPVRAFLLNQTREKDLALFVKFSGMDKPETRDDIPLHVLVPGFILSELRTAFQIAFVVFIPFLVIDMVVASVLMSMGMMMLPPILVALPFKVLLFVLVDGWYLVIKSLIESFAAAGG